MAYGSGYSSLSKCFEDNKIAAVVSLGTIRLRCKAGMKPEEAFETPPGSRGGKRHGPHTVEGVAYPDLVTLAAEYGLPANTVYKRHSRGKRGDDLIPPKRRKRYVPPPESIKFKFFAGGEGYKSQAEACRVHGVKEITYRKRLQAGRSVEEALGIVEMPDRRRKDTPGRAKRRKSKRARVERPDLTVDGVTYPTYAALARAYGLKYHVVRQRIVDGGRTAEEAVRCPAKGTRVNVGGQEYPTMAAAARAHGLTAATLQARLKCGNTLEEALGYKIRKTSRTVIYDGQSYRNLSELARAYGIPHTTLVQRIRTGSSLEEAIEAGERIINKGRYNETILRRDPELASSTSTLYFVRVRIGDRSLFKIGITTTSVEGRLMGLSYEVLATRDGPLLQSFELEQKLLGHFRDQCSAGLDGGALDGYTEVLDLSEDDVESILAILE